VAGGLVPLHASAIETPAGIVALVGQSGSGKSTLCAAAVLAGYPYVADEITAVSPDDLTVRPFHRPIGLRRGGAAALGIDYPEQRTDPDDGAPLRHVHPWVVAGPLSSGGTLTVIVIVSRAEQATPTISPIEGPAALVELAQHTVLDDDQLAAGFAGLDHIVRRVPIARLDFDTPNEGVALIAEIVAELVAGLTP
jgi:hypothetical protein